MASNEDLADVVSIALRKAYQLGQVYWQQADSESYRQQDKSALTAEKFNQLVEETRETVLERVA